MGYWVCVDDTDMPGTKGTGCLVQEICEEIEAEGVGTCSAISRHQLFVHEDIPFTSHNSAMCFEIDLKNGSTRSEMIDYMVAALENRFLEGSDPGLCVTTDLSPANRERLIAFGKKAKKAVCTKVEAYGLAGELGIHLSEHGGTGGGIIGALAGTGLRMSGNDGRYRGWYHLGNPSDQTTVAELCNYPFIEAVVGRDGRELSSSQPLAIGSGQTKTVRVGFRQVVVATANENAATSGVTFRTITKQEAKAY